MQPTGNNRYPMAANGLMDELVETARAFFGRVPQLVTTDRSGRFEGGWVRPHSARPYRALTVRKKLPLDDKQRLRQRMSTLVREYARHPHAHESAVRRVTGWPDSIEITLMPHP